MWRVFHSWSWWLEEVFRWVKSVTKTRFYFSSFTFMHLASKAVIRTLEALYSLSFVLLRLSLERKHTGFGKLWPARGRLLNNNPSYEIVCQNKMEADGAWGHMVRITSIIIPKKCSVHKLLRLTALSTFKFNSCIRVLYEQNCKQWRNLNSPIRFDISILIYRLFMSKCLIIYSQKPLFLWSWLRPCLLQRKQ